MILYCQKDRSNYPELLYNKYILKNFKIFKGKQLIFSLAFKALNFIRKENAPVLIPLNFTKCSRKGFYRYTPGNCF